MPKQYFPTCAALELHALQIDHEEPEEIINTKDA